MGGMLRLSRLTLLVLALAPASAAFAETDQERQAREDLERQLKSMVGTPPTKIRVDFVGLDQPNYELLEATFELDGTRLPVSDLKKLSSDGEHLIFHGDVRPGEHRLESKFHFHNTTSQVVSEEGGYKWKKTSTVTFRAESGIEVQVKVTPELDLKAEIKNRIKITSPATVKMLAKLDDGTMPDPMERPKVAVAEVDAGTADAGVEVVKGETAAEKAAKLAAAKKKEKEDAAAAKLAAAEEKKRLAEEAKAARLAAAEEKKRAAAEAAQAKKDAALAAKNGNAGTTAGTRVDAAPVVVDAGVAIAEVDAGAPEPVDAGPVAVAVAPPPAPKKPEPPPPPKEESGLPMPVLILIGVAVLGVILFLVARRKKPTDP
jgi:hypothetical protein